MELSDNETNEQATEEENNSGSDFEKIDEPTDIPLDFQFDAKAGGSGSKPQKKKFGHRMKQFNKKMKDKIDNTKLSRKFRQS